VLGTHLTWHDGGVAEVAGGGPRLGRLGLRRGSAQSPYQASATDSGETTLRRSLQEVTRNSGGGGGRRIDARELEEGEGEGEQRMRWRADNPPPPPMRKISEPRPHSVVGRHGGTHGGARARQRRSSGSRERERTGDAGGGREGGDRADGVRN
jgi:hypothetical protein